MNHAGIHPNATTPCNRTLTRLALAALLALGLTACGGGGDNPDATGLTTPTTASAAAPTTAPFSASPETAAPAVALDALRVHAMAVSSGSVDPLEAARQLMDYAEATFPQYFPSHETTQALAPFSYRHYAATGVYVGVAVDENPNYLKNGVYVMGGAFGDVPQYVGQLTEFINPNYKLVLASDKAVVTQGDSTTVAVTVQRTPGFTGPVEISLSGLPAGVSANTVVVPSGATTANVVLAAQGSAPHSLPTPATLASSGGGLSSTNPLSVTVRGLPGVVDTSFGGGIVVTPMGIGEDYAQAVAVQADGKVVVVGSSATLTGTFVSVVRYLRDGGLDPSFGNAGKQITQIGTRSDAAAAVLIQPDGKIVVAGSTDQGTPTGMDFFVLRYRTDGTLDPAFGQGGKVVTAFSNDADRAWALALQADGKIVVAGESNTGATTSGVDFALARYLPDGTPDASFGNGGKVVTPIKTSSGRDVVYALALPVVNGEQRILAVGGEGDFLAARYLPNGVPDAGFGNGGRIAGLFNANIGAARAVTLLPDGRAVLAGDIGHDFTAVQLTTTGTLDAGFGIGGKFSHGVASNDNWDAATAVVRQADGKLVLGGWAYTGNSSSGDFAALRLTPNGTLDNSFGNLGVVIRPTASGTKNDIAHGLVLQADERVPAVRAIQAGEANGSNHDFSVIRLWL